MSEPGSTEDYRRAQASLMRVKEEHVRAKTADLRVETLLKKAKTADFQVRTREREAHIEVLEARAEKLRLQALELGGPSDREAQLREKIDRLRSQTRKIADRYGLESEDSDDDEELESFESKTPVRRLLKRSPKRR